MASLIFCCCLRTCHRCSRYCHTSSPSRLSLTLDMSKFSVWSLCVPPLFNRRRNICNLPWTTHDIPMVSLSNLVSCWWTKLNAWLFCILSWRCVCSKVEILPSIWLMTSWWFWLLHRCSKVVILRSITLFSSSKIVILRSHRLMSSLVTFWESNRWFTMPLSSCNPLLFSSLALTLASIPVVLFWEFHPVEDGLSLFCTPLPSNCVSPMLFWTCAFVVAIAFVPIVPLWSNSRAEDGLLLLGWSAVVAAVFVVVLSLCTFVVAEGSLLPRAKVVLLILFWFVAPVPFVLIPFTLTSTSSPGESGWFVALAVFVLVPFTLTSTLFPGECSCWAVRS